MEIQESVRLFRSFIERTQLRVRSPEPAIFIGRMVYDTENEASIYRFGVEITENAIVISGFIDDALGGVSIEAVALNIARVNADKLFGGFMLDEHDQKVWYKLALPVEMLLIQNYDALLLNFIRLPTRMLHRYKAEILRR